jgi:two-component system response regulator VicR
MAKAVWGNDYPGAANTIKVHIRHLREKLEEDPGNPQLIMTRSGIGYSLAISG